MTRNGLFIFCTGSYIDVETLPQCTRFSIGENLRAGKASLGNIICQLSPLCCFEIQPLCARSWRPKIKCVGMSLANNKHVFIL